MNPAAVAVAAALAASAPGTAWRDYDAQATAACPARHVEWVCDDCRIELMDAFGATLPASLARRVDALADVHRACAAETIGHACASGRTLAAYRRLGLLGRFVAFGCRTVRCEEEASCSRLPAARTADRR